MRTFPWPKFPVPPTRDMSKIIAIVVTYYPNYKTLKTLIETVIPQVDRVVIIDNATPELCAEDLQFSYSVELIVNSSNLGVATAYNQGVSIAQRNEASHIVLFDQDSCPATNMIDVLLHAWRQAKGEGLKVAALGPNYKDTKGMYQSPFVKIKGLGLARVECNAGESVEVDHLISSGCLIDLETLRDIGPFEEQLFIDYVDTEWCLRARKKGYLLLGVGDADMQHSLGDNYLRFLHKRIPAHSPVRHYYLLRNGAWLASQAWVGWRWRIIDCKRLIKIFIVFSLLSDSPWNHCKMMILGFWHFVKGKMGKL